MEDSMTVSENGYSLQVYRDEFAENPREWDNLGTIVCWHRRYNLGDQHEYDSPQDFYESEEYKNAFAILPVYLYDHSGITISNTDFGDRWDSGQIGYIFVTKEKVQQEYGSEITEAMKELIRERLIAETELYDKYLQGECYGFRITDENGEHTLIGPGDVTFTDDGQSHGILALGPEPLEVITLVLYKKI